MGDNLNTAEDNVLNMDIGERSQVSMEIQLKIIKIQIQNTKQSMGSGSFLSEITFQSHKQTVKQ